MTKRHREVQSRTQSLYQVWVFVWDVVVRKFEDDNPNDCLATAKTCLPHYASLGPVTIFEFSPSEGWRLVPHQYQDWSHSLVEP